MRKDVDRLLEDVPSARKRPERFTRKEQAKQALEDPSTAPATTSNAGEPSTHAAPQEDKVLQVAVNCATRPACDAFATPLLTASVAVQLVVLL